MQNVVKWVPQDVFDDHKHIKGIAFCQDLMSKALPMSLLHLFHGLLPMNKIHFQVAIQIEPKYSNVKFLVIWILLENTK